MKKAEEYKYYFTQQPADLGTVPKDRDNPPIRIENYKGRTWVEYDTRLAWGELIYAKPLTEETMNNCKLMPSRHNHDVWQLMDVQAQIVGKWEDVKRIPDPKRLTWFYPDFGCYVVKEFVSPEQLAERACEVELQQAAAGRKRARRTIR